jgi:phosphatidate cytidylyltransferase
MAFNIAIFKTRALTATLFAIIMLAGLLWNQWSFIILFSIIHFGCWYEFIKLMKKIHLDNYGYYLPTGLLYITLPVLMMIDLSYPVFKYGTISRDFLPMIPVGMIFSIWINDTMAYVIGSLIGKTPFSKISPKKTWEGTIGGAVLCVLLTGYFIAPLISGNRALGITYFVHPVNWFIIAGICAVFGTCGDLLESKLKRMADIKDSGSFMPGHGGFLDRFDSILVATPFVWLYVYFFIQ